MQEWKKNLEIIEEEIQNYDKSYGEYLKEKYSVYKYICVFGVGNIGLITAKELMEHGVKVDFFCDNDVKKSGKSYMGLPCYLPEKLNDIKDETMVIISTRYYKEIYLQLSEMEVKNTDRVFTNKYEIKEKLERYGKREVIEKIVQTTELLSDEKSKNVYTIVLKNWLTLNYHQEELDAVFTDDQYFCKDIFTLSENEYLVDGGAYDGDTFEIFLKETDGKFGGAHLFELSESNYQRLLKNISTYDENIQKKVCCINKGLSDKDAMIRYCDNDEGSAVDSVGDTEGYLTSIDETCKDIPVTYIKMDIEGSEKQALYGAQKTIQKKKAKLAICLYHKFEDFWELPLYIHELLPEYKLYIRHHTDLLNETVCYAIV